MRCTAAKDPWLTEEEVWEYVKLTEREGNAGNKEKEGGKDWGGRVDKGTRNTGPKQNEGRRHVEEAWQGRDVPGRRMRCFASRALVRREFKSRNPT